MPEQDGGVPLHAEFRGLPATPAEPGDRVVTGLLPHEPLHFQTPEGLDSLSDPVCLVTGQRGVGKTQLAAAYARQRAHDGWLVAWIGAETPGQIAAGLVELADHLGLYWPEDGTEIALARVRNHLRTRPGRALLVFDNVVSLDAVRPHLPSASTCQVVITTTARGSQLGRDVPVEVFTPEAAARFLRDATGLDGDATELAAELGHLPLALAQAAARIRRARWDYARYLERFRELPAAEHLVRRDGDPYPHGAAKAIRMALEPFEDSELVRILSVLSPDGVSRDLLGDDDELLDLHEASLVEFAGDASVRMHRLVQRVVRDGGEWVALAARLLLDRVEFGDELVRQVDALWANTGERQMSKAVLVLRLWEAGFLGSTARFDRAGAIAEEVYAEGLARLGEDEEFLLAARQIASAVGSADLLPRLRIDLVTSREAHGADHPAALNSARVLAQHLVRTGEAEEAVSVLERALEPWRGEPVEAEHFGALDDLAHGYTLTGRALEAIAVLERSLGARPEALYTRSLLSDAFGAAGRFADARRVCEQVWDGYRRTAGPGDPHTLFAAGKLGAALYLNGERDLARSLLLVVRALGTDLLGPDHLIVTTAHGALQIVRQD